MLNLFMALPWHFENLEPNFVTNGGPKDINFSVFIFYLAFMIILYMLFFDYLFFSFLIICILSFNLFKFFL